MKLLTHNMLSSKGIKGVKVGFPLKIEVKVVLDIFKKLVGFCYGLEILLWTP